MSVHGASGIPNWNTQQEAILTFPCHNMRLTMMAWRTYEASIDLQQTLGMGMGARLHYCPYNLPGRQCTIPF